MHQCTCTDIIFKQGLRQCKTSCWFDALFTGIYLNKKLRKLFKPILTSGFDICTNISCDTRRAHLIKLTFILGRHNLDEGNQSYLLWYRLLNNNNLFKSTYILNLSGFSNISFDTNVRLVAVVNPHSDMIAQIIAETMNIFNVSKMAEISLSYPFSLQSYKLEMVTVSTGSHVVSLIRCEDGQKWIRYDNESTIKGFFVDKEMYLALNNKLISNLGYTVCIYIK